MVTLNPTLQQLTTYPAEALYAKKRALQAAGRRIFDFSVGDPIEPTDPQIVEAFRASVPAVSQYPSIAGSDDIRRACAEWVERRFGVQLDPSRQILPSSGSKEAIFHLPLTFIDPRGSRRRVLFGAPAYPVYERGTLFAGGDPWSVELRPEQGYRLQPWALDADAIAQTAIIWVNYPHNPTAATVDEAYLRRLAHFCSDRDILLCSDECYVDLYLEPPPPPSILQVTQDGVLAFHSLSKRSGMTGYRAGFIAGDPALIAQLQATRANFGVAPSHMVQQTAAYAWRDEAHAGRRRAIFRDKRDAFVRFFAEVGLTHRPCQATFYLWVKTPSPATEQRGDAAVAWAEVLADAGILVAPAPLLGVDQPYVRLALVPSLEDCHLAIDVWRQTIAEQS